MYSTGPATIALTEINPSGLNTYHFKDKKDCLRALLRNRPWFDLVLTEIEHAKQIWEKLDAIDAAEEVE